MERHGEAFEEGVRLTVVGRKLMPGDRAPHFELDMMPPEGGMPAPVTLADTHGSVRLLNVINSIDTPVCNIETRRWQTMSADLGSGVEIMTISMDLPFALARWGGTEGVTHALLSSHRSESFGVDYGVLLREWRLLQRAVFVLDAEGVVVHSEYVADQMQEPDYDAAVAGVARAG